MFYVRRWNFITEVSFSGSIAFQRKVSFFKVWITLSLHDLQSVPGGEEAGEKRWDDEFVHYLLYIGKDDFVGVQNYTRELMGADGPLPAPAGAGLTDMGHEFYPEGLAHVIRKVNQTYKGDIIVKENGVYLGSICKSIS